MKLRLEPSDEFMHPGPEPTFNESMYFNFCADEGVSGFVRIGNRPNERYAETTVCLYLPDGRVAFMFRRPEIEGNERFDAGGTRFEVLDPFERLTVRYDGTVILLEDPLAMADPRVAFTENPAVPASVDLVYTGASTPFGGEPEVSHERPGEEFARGHYEQLVRATGTVRVGDEEWTVDARGLRDHSWGPRTWQAPWYYRWLTVNLDDGTGMMLNRIARQDGDGTRGGFVWDGERLRTVRHVDVRTGWTDGTPYHRSVEATFTLDDDPAAPPRVLTGEVRNLIPLRNRRDGRVTRISEGLTRWRVDRPLRDGGATTGHGLSEYLDQLVEGVPVGLDE